MPRESILETLFGRKRNDLKKSLGTKHHHHHKATKIAPPPVNEQPPNKTTGPESNIPPEILSVYHDLSHIGEGTYGIVYKATSIRDGSLVALKRIRLTSGDCNETLASTGVSTTAVREMILLRELRHSNIVDLLGVYFSSSPTIQLWLAFEYCAMDLRQYVKFCSLARRKLTGSKNNLGIPIKQVLHFSYHIMQGLKFCHSLNILHRDMKPQNILLTHINGENNDKGGGGGGGNATIGPGGPGGGTTIGGRNSNGLNQIMTTNNPDRSTYEQALHTLNPMASKLYLNWDMVSAKIADLGLARTCRGLNENLTQEVITLWYRPPELLLGYRQYTEAVDIWSVGCIIAEMILGRALFPGDSEIATLFKIFELLGTPNQDTWPEAMTMPYFQDRFPNWQNTDPRSSLKNLLSPDGSIDSVLLDLLCKCLEHNPTRRISAAEAVAVLQEAV